MNKYNTFLTVFIISVIAMIVFLVFYLQAIFGVIRTVDEFRGEEPSLTYRILGIVHVAKNKTVKDGEKALWIIGFIIMGFITAIVFLVMAKGRKFVE